MGFLLERWSENILIFCGLFRRHMSQHSKKHHIALASTTSFFVVENKLGEYLEEEKELRVSR